MTNIRFIEIALIFYSEKIKKDVAALNDIKNNEVSSLIDSKINKLVQTKMIFNNIVLNDNEIKNKKICIDSKIENKEIINHALTNYINKLKEDILFINNMNNNGIEVYNLLNSYNIQLEQAHDVISKLDSFFMIENQD